MGKLLLLAAAIVLVYFLLKGYQRSLRQRPPEGGGASPEPMVRCARCGVHLPRSESLATAGEYFCSEEHRREGPA